MEPRIPLPTDNIYKFYALFGLILFIFSFSAVIYLNRSTNNLIFQTIISIEALESIEEKERTSVQQTKLALNKRKQEIALSDKKFFITCISIVGAVAVILMIVGFHHWQTKIQPLQDELAELSVKKLKKELRTNSSKRR